MTGVLLLEGLTCLYLAVAFLLWTLNEEKVIHTFAIFVAVLAVVIQLTLTFEVAPKVFGWGYVNLSDTYPGSFQAIVKAGIKYHKLALVPAETPTILVFQDVENGNIYGVKKPEGTVPDYFVLTEKREIVAITPNSIPHK